MLIERNWCVETERPPSCGPGSVVPLRSGSPSNTLTAHDNSKRLRQPVFGSSLDLLEFTIYPGPFSPMSRLVMWLFLAADPAPPIPPQFGLDHHPRRSPDDGFSSSAVPAMEHGTTILLSSIFAHLRILVKGIARYPTLVTMWEELNGCGEARN